MILKNAVMKQFTREKDWSYRIVVSYNSLIYIDIIKNERLAQFS